MQMDEQKILGTVKELPLLIDNLLKRNAFLEERNRILEEKEERFQSLESAFRQMHGILMPLGVDNNQKEEKKQVVEGNKKNKENGRKTQATQSLFQANVVSDPQSPSKIKKSSKRITLSLSQSRSTSEEHEESEEMEDSNLCKESVSESESDEYTKNKTKAKKKKPIKGIATPTPKKTPAPKQPRYIEGFTWNGKRDPHRKAVYDCDQCHKEMRGDSADKHKCPFAAAALVPEHILSIEGRDCVGTLINEPGK
jgi:hypothetical protein